MTTLTSFLVQHKKRTNDTHTHTWFAAGPLQNNTSTLHVPNDDVPLLRRLLVADVTKGKQRSGQGSSSVTEKLAKVMPFRFAADLDFKSCDIKVWAQARGYTDGKTLLVQLQSKLRDIVKLYRTVVNETTQTASVMILATRLPYKIHLHFPEVIVDTTNAKVISAAFAQRLAAEHADIYNDTVVDSSVYGTGLRLLYCHKGSMTNVKKREQEKQDHEALFGVATYSDVYYVTDLESWEQNMKPSVQDLETTSLHTGEDAKLTQLQVVVTGAKRTRNGVSSKKRHVTSVASDKELVKFLSRTFCIPSEDIRSEKKDMEDGKLAISTRCRDCPFAKKRHHGNQLYFIVSPNTVELRCHDEDCHEAIVKDLPKTLAPLLFTTQHTTQLPTETELRDRRQDLMASSFQNIQELYPRVEVVDDDLNAVDTLTNLGGVEGFIRHLSVNKWCPICQRHHDAPENCIYTTVTAQQLICKKSVGHIGLPFDKEKVQFTFNIQVVNNNSVINNYGVTDVQGPRNFGLYENFPTIYEDVEINRLCYESVVTGATYQVSKYVSRIVSRDYVYVDDLWYRYLQTHWSACKGPDTFFAEDVAEVYRTLMQTYKDESQVKWLQQLVSDVSNKNRRRPFVEELEGILSESNQKPVLLDGQHHLFPFLNGVYDSILCAFREHRREDYITSLITYDFPTKSDPVIRASLSSFFDSIMPDQSTREFLLTYLALHLEGRNRHQIAVILTGTGGNGKSLLKLLMKTVFQHLETEAQAEFLTEERPSDERPSVSVMNMRHKCCVFASEPQAGKKINGGFLKVISGGDVLRGRLCRSNVMIEYLPRFIPTLLCNAIPLIDCGATDVRAIWRRLRIIHFPNEFLEDDKPILFSYQRRGDPGIADRIPAWGPEMMLLLTEIYETYVRNDRRLHVPDQVVKRIEEQQQENNRFGFWLTQNLVASPGAKLHIHRIVEVYNATDPEEPIPTRMGSGLLKNNGYKVAASARLENCTYECGSKRSNAPILNDYMIRPDE